MSFMLPGEEKLKSLDLGCLTPDFYAKIAEYLKKLREENQKTDSKPPKINLLINEAKNVQQMLGELLTNRYEKLLQNITQNQKIPKEMLTTEEIKMCETLLLLLATIRSSPVTCYMDK